MDITSLIGIISGFASLLTGFLLEDGKLGMLSPLKHPSPYIIIFGGTFSCVILSFPLSDLKLIPSILKLVFTQKKANDIAIINELVSFSETARKEGLLSLEQISQSHENEFIRRGLALVVDGIEPATIKDILVREATLHEANFEIGAKIFEAAGGFAPTMGVAGTVLGMISILADMSDSGSLGGKISTAFIATLLGVGFANLAFLPIAGKIKAKAGKETEMTDIIIEGLLSIQAGESPKILKEKLNLAQLEKMHGGKDGNSKEGTKEGGGKE